MCYITDDPHSLAEHSKHHALHQNGISYRITSNDVVLARHDDGRIIRLDTYSSKASLNKLDQLLQMINKELGLPSVTIKPKSTYLVYISSQSTSKMIGLVEGEAIERANWLVSLHPLMASKEEVDNVELGVACLWTHCKHRRRGVATRLLDALVRQHFRSNFDENRSRLAFSDPTYDGAKLASSYMAGHGQVLIYMFKHTKEARRTRKKVDSDPFLDQSLLDKTLGEQSLWIDPDDAREFSFY